MRTSASSHIPYAVQEATVEAAGKLFWYRAPFGRLLRRAGVPDALVSELLGTGASKYSVMRSVLEELDARGDDGVQVQQQIIRELVDVPTSGQEIDKAQAQSAQQTLRRLARSHGILRDKSREPISAIDLRQRTETREAQRREGERHARLAELHREYCRLLADSSDRQGRGYRLEEMVGEVALLERLGYRPPFRKGTVTQTDGMLSVDGFQYLVEARWRAIPPDVQGLAAFSHKVSRNLQSTRGLFLSVVGFRTEVVAELETGVKNLILVSGQEFALILEGRLTLADALRRKVEEAAKKASLFYDLGCP